jgi:hypothetical protein
MSPHSAVTSRLIVHDPELWARPAPPIPQPATPEPPPVSDSAPSAIAAPAAIAARRALCAACEHLATPEQCGCTAGLCRHPQATNPNLTALASAACPLGRWQALSV